MLAKGERQEFHGQISREEKEGADWPGAVGKIIRKLTGRHWQLNSSS